MRSTIERESKLVPGEGFELSAFGRALPTRTFTSTYHDTEDLRLATHGLTLRHRTEDGAGAWQLKIPHGAARIELEVPGPPARPPTALLDLLPAYVRGRTLGPVARLRTRRARVRAEGAEIVEDAVAVLDGQRVVRRFRELEVELVDGDAGALERAERALLAAGAQPAAFVPKLHRALDLAYPPSRRGGDAVTSWLDALRAALGEEYDRLLAHDPGTRLGADPEDLHQMRVATRRARAFLRAARPVLDREWAGALLSELRWLGSALGPARDLDVLLEHLRADVAELDGRTVADSLLVQLEREGSEARGAVLRALSDERYLALLDRVDGVEPQPAPGEHVTLAELWGDELRRTTRRFERLGSAPSDEDLHAARVQVKRARYAAELAGGELGRPGERFVSAAKELQDILGAHQDACVAEERIRAWAEGESARPAVVGELVSRERERRRRARKEWPAAWATLARRGRKARP